MKIARPNYSADASSDADTKRDSYWGRRIHSCLELHIWSVIPPYNLPIEPQVRHVPRYCVSLLRPDTQVRIAALGNSMDLYRALHSIPSTRNLSFSSFIRFIHTFCDLNTS